MGEFNKSCSGRAINSTNWSRRALGLVGVIGSFTAAMAVATSHSGPTVVEAATSSTTVRVHGAGADFTISLPPTSVSTFKWKIGGAAASEWTTAASGATLTQRVVAKPAIPLSSNAGNASTTITLSPTTRYQVVDGFGGAMTDAASSLIVHSPYRNAILNDLFGTARARFNFVRVPMGATDLIASAYASYDDSTTADPSLTKFTLAHDLRATIPVLQQARTIRPSLRLIGVPWSAPAWMKTGGTFRGTCLPGRNTLKAAYFGSYANYFVRFVKGYAAAGLPVSMVSMQNEPQNCNSSYPTMNLSVAQEELLASKLRAAFTATGLKVGIMGWDHNWYDEGASAGSAPTSYPATLLSSNTGVTAVGYHCYNSNGNPDAFQTQVSKANYMTECSGFTNYSNAAQNLVWEVHNAILGPLRYGAKASLYWSLALGSDSKPHIGGCATCRGMVAINRATGRYTLSEDYYYWTQFSRFIDPGARRIASTQSGAIETVAFQNPDASIVLVVLNRSTGTSRIGHIVQWDGDTKAQKTAWLVGSDGHRRWISDIATYDCLKAAGAPGPDVLPAWELDQYPDLYGVWATCP